MPTQTASTARGNTRATSGEPRNYALTAADRETLLAYQMQCAEAQRMINVHEANLSRLTAGSDSFIQHVVNTQKLNQQPGWTYVPSEDCSSLIAIRTDQIAALTARFAGRGIGQMSTAAAVA